MNTFKLFISIMALLVASQATAVPVEHPAHPEASAKVFQPADYFAAQPFQVAAAEHQHDVAETSGKDSTAEDGKGCKRGEGKGCCCCKCCDKEGGAKEGMGCMKKSGDGHDHGSMKEGKDGCGMMKKSMEMNMEKQDGKAGAGDAHEGHH